MPFPPFIVVQAVQEGPVFRPARARSRPHDLLDDLLALLAAELPQLLVADEHPHLWLFHHDL